MIYLLSTIVNRHEEFRTAIDKDAGVGVFDLLIKLKEASRRDRVRYAQSEILNLTWNDLDLENRLAHLKERKNRTARHAPLVDRLMTRPRTIDRLKTTTMN